MARAAIAGIAGTSGRITLLSSAHRPFRAALLAAWIAGAASGMLPARSSDAQATDPAGPDAVPGAAETAELRRILMSQAAVRRPEAAEALARLRATGLEEFCRGVQETADLLAAAGDAAPAAFLYERSLEECPRPGRTLLAISALIGSEQVACEPALAAVESVPSPRDADDRYAADLGSAVVQMVCLGAGAPEDRVESLADHAASVAFGDAAAQAHGYVRARIVAELNRRAGRRKAEAAHLLAAATEVCSSLPTLEALVAADRSPAAGATPAREAPGQGAPLPALGAGGLLGELWRRQVLEGIDPDRRACLAELLRALRVQESRQQAPRATSGVPGEIDRLLGVGPG